MAIKRSSQGGTPFGTTANRPANPAVGQTYYNGTLGYLEMYTAAGWISATGANDFSLNITGVYTTVTFDQSYSSGSYSIVSFLTDNTLDVYAYATDGSLAGYTGTKAFTASQRFNKMVVLGGSAGDVLQFSYKTTYPTTPTTSEVTAGPFITNITPSFMENINDTVTITGGNFATDVSVAFTGTGYSSTVAKTIVRSSSSQLIVTRPDNFPISASPFTVTVTNPSIANQPLGSSAHISLNSITAGNAPVWVTSSVLPIFTRNVSYSTTLSGTDSDGGSSVSYSLFSGSLPTGLSLNSSTGVISGTPTSALNTSFTIRLTDAGLNYVDRQFTLSNTGPVWSTAATLPTFTRNSAYSTTVIASDDSGVSPAYSLFSGSLPTGLSLSSGGVISGTPSSSTNASFTIRATDSAGNTADRAFTMPNVSPVWVTSGTVGLAWSGSQQLSATDDDTITYSLVSGTLPTGTTLSSSGLLTAGTTNSSGSSVTIRATDTAGNIADRALTITVSPYVFTSHTFTNAGVTGASGPTLAQVQSAYSSSSWTQNTTFLSVPSQGIQRWYVPSSGNYTVTIAGARGGSGNSGYGRGYVGTTTLSLTQGHQLDILVGQVGSNGGYSGGGGGGSFIHNASTSFTKLAVAGAGGGGGWSGGGNDASGSSISGTGTYIGHAGTTDSNPGSVGTPYSAGGGGVGGGAGANGGVGGFGSGGGGGFGAGAGGGGNNGGSPSSGNVGGQGGGSFTSGTSFINGSLNTGHGYVTITKV